MEQPIIDQCDDECVGAPVSDVAVVQKQMITEKTALDMADVFKALGDSTRVRIIYALLQKELCVHDLTVVLDMGQSAISHQLASLRKSRIVKRRKVGKQVFYSLDDHHIEQIFVQTLNHLKHE